jgi:hypothetical protein
MMRGRGHAQGAEQQEATTKRVIAFTTSIMVVWWACSVEQSSGPCRSRALALLHWAGLPRKVEIGNEGGEADGSVVGAFR